MQPSEAERWREDVIDPTSPESLSTFRESQRLLHESYKHLSTLSVGTAVAGATIVSATNPPVASSSLFVVAEALMLVSLSLSAYRLFRVPSLLQFGNTAAILIQKRTHDRSSSMLWWWESLVPVIVYGLGLTMLVLSLSYR